MCVIWNTDVGRVLMFSKCYFLHEIAPLRLRDTVEGVVLSVDFTIRR